MCVCVSVNASRPNRRTYGDEIWQGPPSWSGEGPSGFSDRLGRFEAAIKAKRAIVLRGEIMRVTHKMRLDGHLETGTDHHRVIAQGHIQGRNFFPGNAGHFLLVTNEHERRKEEMTEYNSDPRVSRVFPLYITTVNSIVA